MEQMDCLDLAKKFLERYWGSPEMLTMSLAADQRLGQAFFNSLAEQHQDVLRGTNADPFYDDRKIPEAIRVLLRHERKWKEAAKRAQTYND